MRTLLLTLPLLALSPLAHANGDLALEWRKMIAAAKENAKVTVASGHTGSHGGVSIMTLNDTPKFSDGRAGDPALAFFNASAKLFAEWADKHKAGKSSSNVSNGELSTYIKTLNGDFFSVVFQPAPGGHANAIGTVTFTFVDASEFIRKGPAGMRIPQLAERSSPAK